MEDLILALAAGLMGGALYAHLWPRAYRRFRKREDRQAGLRRYQNQKDKG